MVHRLLTERFSDSCLSALLTEVLPEDSDHRKQDSFLPKDSTEGFMLKANSYLTLLPAQCRAEVLKGQGDTVR